MAEEILEQGTGNEGTEDDYSAADIQYVELSDLLTGDTTKVFLALVPSYEHESLGISKITIPCEQLISLCLRINSTFPRTKHIFKKIIIFPEEIKIMQEFGATPLKMCELNLKSYLNAQNLINVVIREPIITDRFDFCKSTLLSDLAELVLICEVMYVRFEYIEELIRRVFEMDDVALQLLEDLRSSRESFKTFSEELKELGSQFEKIQLNEIKTGKLGIRSRQNASWPNLCGDLCHQLGTISLVCIYVVFVIAFLIYAFYSGSVYYLTMW